MRLLLAVDAFHRLDLRPHELDEHADHEASLSML